MFSLSGGQALLSGPDEDDALLTMPYSAQSHPLTNELLLENNAFVGGTIANQALKREYQGQQFHALGDSEWQDGNHRIITLHGLPEVDYSQQHELGAASWNSQLSSFAGTDYSKFYSLPQDVYSQYQAPSPNVAFGMAPMTAVYHWPEGGSISRGIFSASSPTKMEEVAPYLSPEASFIPFTKEPRLFDGQVKSLVSDAAASFVPPQAIWQDEFRGPSLATPEPLFATTPSFGDFSSTISAADASDISDVYATSPISSMSGASGSAKSPPSATPLTKRREPTPTKGKAPSTKRRYTRRRTRLPSAGKNAPSPSSNVFTVSSSAKKPGRAASSRKRAPLTLGPPYRRIQDMDPATRDELDRLLLSYRASGTPYKDIMNRLSDIYLGNHNTLRGRLRTLTLAPKMRIRNPVWEENHIKLLKQAVANGGCKNPNTHKISWAKVSEHIHERTGPNSYKFSVTACSRKWQELFGRKKDKDRE